MTHKARRGEIENAPELKYQLCSYILEEITEEISKIAEISYEQLFHDEKI